MAYSWDNTHTDTVTEWTALCNVSSWSSRGTVRIREGTYVGARWLLCSVIHKYCRNYSRLLHHSYLSFLFLVLHFLPSLLFRHLFLPRHLFAPFIHSIPFSSSLFFALYFSVRSLAQHFPLHSSPKNPSFTLSLHRTSWLNHLKRRRPAKPWLTIYTWPCLNLNTWCPACGNVLLMPHMCRNITYVKSLVCLFLLAGDQTTTTAHCHDATCSHGGGGGGVWISERMLIPQVRAHHIVCTLFTYLWAEWKPKS